MVGYTSPYIHTSIALPPQMISLKEKFANDGEWGKQNMDAFEQIARMHYSNNLHLLENYEMLKGRFFYKHYIGDAGYQDMIQLLGKEFEIPTTLRHYDFIAPIVNTLSGEYQKRPDVFRVRDFSEKGTSEFRRKKTELLSAYISNKIMQEINIKLAEQGIDPNLTFESEEEQQAYTDFVNKTVQMLTPSEIETYMKTDYLTSAEIWGQHQLEYDKERFKMAEKEKVEFEDMLIADRAFRHFYTTYNDYNQETWNPINVFFDKSSDVYNVEEGNYVGRIFMCSISDVIDRYGHKMTKAQIESLQKKFYKKEKKWDYAKGTEYVYTNYLYPFKGFEGFDIARTYNNFQSEIPNFDSGFFNNLYNNSIFNEKNGYVYIVEAYWKSLEKEGLVSYIDPETGILRKVIVDESFITPEGWTEIVNDSYSNAQNFPVNSVCWTWRTKIWKGIKICLKSYNKELDDIYLDVGPNDFQNKGKLPVIGNIFSVRNSKSASLVDLVKPYQIGFNLCINQAYQFAEKEIGMFMIFDVNMLLNDKDWGGEDAWDKWMTVAKATGILPVDTSPQNMRANLAASGGYLPKIIDLNFAAQMVSRIELAKFFKQLALEQIGFNQFRLGTFTNRDTATGIEAGQQQSYAQTETYFTNFSNYVKRIYETNLEIAKYSQSKKEKIELLNIKSDLTKAFIETTPEDLAFTDLGCLITNSQEYLRQLKTLRQIGIQNNTSGASMYDLATMVVSNSPAEIMNKLKQSDEYKKAMEQQQLQMQQQQMQQAAQMKQFEEEKKDERQMRELELKAEIARNQGQQQPVDNSEMDYANLDLKSSKIQSDDSFKRDQLNVQKELKLKELDLKEKKINADLQNQNKKLETVRVLKNQEL